MQLPYAYIQYYRATNSIAGGLCTFGGLFLILGDQGPIPPKGSSRIFGLRYEDFAVEPLE